MLNNHRVNQNLQTIKRGDRAKREQWPIRTNDSCNKTSRVSAMRTNDSRNVTSHECYGA